LSIAVTLGVLSKGSLSAHFPDIACGAGLGDLAPSTIEVEMSLLYHRRTVQIALAIFVGAASNALAQEPPKPGSAATAPDTGQMAPDFTLPGATRFGLLKDAVKLSSLRGQTVVLAFFPKARTKG
jgi:hypothetical protein